MWIPSKITQPAPLHHAVTRPRLFEQLEAASSHKLILFRSSAGYGKSTLASQWLRTQDNVAWYNLDDSDNNPFQFANYLIKALNTATKDHTKSVAIAAERNQFTCLKAFFAQVLASLDAHKETTYLVLDDYHFITEPEIHQGLRFFIKHLPTNVTVLITSRTQPPIGTANLRIQGQLLELTDEALAFDLSESLQFFKQCYPHAIDTKTATTLHHRIEGWPSALQLIALHALQQGLSPALDTAAADYDRTHLWEYLAEEVFDQLDHDSQTFLLQCAVLDFFNAELVEQLTQREDVLPMLESLNRRGVFLHALDNSPGWFRFHRLFAEFLTHQVRAQRKIDIVEAHRKAAQAWLYQANPKQALLHAKQAHDHRLTATILLQHGWQMFNMGESAIVKQALDTLDHDELFSQPKLALLRCWITQTQHQYHIVSEMLEESFHHFTRLNVSLSDGMEGEFNALRAQVAINSNQLDEALALSQLALGQLPSNIYRGRIVATAIIGEVHHCRGKLSHALSMMQQAEKMARQYRVYPQALWAILQQTEVHIAQGNTQLAFELLEQGKKLVNEQQLQQDPLYEFLLRLYAQVYLGWHRLDDAERCANASLDVLVDYNESKCLHAYSILARIALLRGETDKAGRFVEKTQHLMQEESYHLDWLAHAHLAMMLYWQATDNKEAISHWLNVTSHPHSAENHFEQLEWRNILRAALYLNNTALAEQALSVLQRHAQAHQLITDTGKNQLLAAQRHSQLGQTQLALEALAQAIAISQRTPIIAEFIADKQTLTPMLLALQKHHSLSQLDRHRVVHILDVARTNQNTNMAHFDEAFIEKLLTSPTLPEVVRTSPLTQREWQVLGLIYAGYSNERIAIELDVAGTTIKTHIRNLYQKLQLANRQEAIAMAENLVKLIGT